MSLSMQIFYPSGDGTTFDHHYYASKHVDIVGKSFCQHREKTIIT